MIVVIGMDPGPTPGLVKLIYGDTHRLLDVAVVQCTANQALDVLQMWLRPLSENNRTVGRGTPLVRVYFQGEKFVIGPKSYRSGSAGARTRELAGSASVLATTHGAYVNDRDASTAKTWATNARLEKAGLYAPTAGMVHARDAARHALYTACKDALIPDPLSRKAKRA